MRNENESRLTEHEVNKPDYSFALIVFEGIGYVLIGCLFAGYFLYVGAERLASRGNELAGVALFLIPPLGVACGVAFQLLAATAFKKKWRLLRRVALFLVAISVLVGTVWVSYAYESFSPKHAKAKTVRPR